MTVEPGPPDTIVLIHGFWVTPRSWEHWVERYEARGYTVLAPAYPGFEVEVEALNADPSPIEAVTVPQIIDKLAGMIGELDRPPILMGHLGRWGVHPAPPRPGLRRGRRRTRSRPRSPRSRSSRATPTCCRRRRGRRRSRTTRSTGRSGTPGAPSRRALAEADRHDGSGPVRKVRITHSGGPTVLVELGGWRILTDPTFDRPGRVSRTSGRRTSRSPPPRAGTVPAEPATGR